MAANTQVRLASITAASYAVLVVAGILLRFEQTGSLRALGRSLAQPTVWIALVLAALVAWGLWKRYAWAWWLGLAGGAVQLFRLTRWYLFGPGFGHVPRSDTRLLAVAILTLLVVLLLQRKVRAACSR